MMIVYETIGSGFESLLTLYVIFFAEIYNEKGISIYKLSMMETN